MNVQYCRLLLTVFYVNHPASAGYTVINRRGWICVGRHSSVIGFSPSSYRRRAQALATPSVTRGRAVAAVRVSAATAPAAALARIHSVKPSIKLPVQRLLLHCVEIRLAGLVEKIPRRDPQSSSSRMRFCSLQRECWLRLGVHVVSLVSRAARMESRACSAVPPPRSHLPGCNRGQRRPSGNAERCTQAWRAGPRLAVGRVSRQS